VNTDRFKTGSLSINLIGKLDRDTAAGFALLPRVLCRGSSEFPDMERIAVALDDLYGARVEPIVRKKGELHCIGFYTDFPDSRFISGSGSILEKVVSLTGGILLSPDMREGMLRQDYVDSEKVNLIDDIRAGINDKRGYSIDRLIEEMCAHEAFGINRLGNEAGVGAITPGSLTASYRDILSGSRIEILYCGSAAPEYVEPIIRSALGGLLQRAGAAFPETQVVLYPASDPPRRITEALDVTQGKLVIGFRLGKAMSGKPDYPALMVFNAIFGSCDTSKLFLNVRERLSLCYYISSSLERYKGVMLVSSGVEFSDFDAAIDEIFAQLGNIKKGNVSDQELISAKSTIITAVKSTMDRPTGLLDLYFDSLVAPYRYDPARLCEMIGAVTLDRVVETASEIKPDSIFLLTGRDRAARNCAYDDSL